LEFRRVLFRSHVPFCRTRCPPSAVRCGSLRCADLRQSLRHIPQGLAVCRLHGADVQFLSGAVDDRTEAGERGGAGDEKIGLESFADYMREKKPPEDIMVLACPGL